MVDEARSPRVESCPAVPLWTRSPIGYRIVVFCSAKSRCFAERNTTFNDGRFPGGQVKSPIGYESLMHFRIVGAALLAAVMVVPVVAQDAAKGKRKGKRTRQDASTMLLKQLEEVGLTDDQVAKVKELGKVAVAKMKALRDEAGITAALMKKRTEARKSLTEAGKKGKELAAAISEASGLSEAQEAAMKKANAIRMAFQKEVLGLLTDEQKAKLPEKFQQAARRAGKAAGENGKGGRRKKKDAA